MSRSAWRLGSGSSTEEDTSMLEHQPNRPGTAISNRRSFLQHVAQNAVAGGAATSLLVNAPGAAAAGAPAAGAVRRRPLGKTGLHVSEIGFGGHSWAYKRVPDGKGGLRQVTPDEAERTFGRGLERGVNFLDACTAKDEHTIPGDALRA